MKLWSYETDPALCMTVALAGWLAVLCWKEAITMDAFVLGSLLVLIKQSIDLRR